MTDNTSAQTEAKQNDRDNRNELIVHLCETHGKDKIDQLLAVMSENQVFRHFYSTDDLCSQWKIHATETEITTESQIFLSFRRLLAMANLHDVANAELVAATLAAPMHTEGTLDVAIDGDVEVCGSLDSSQID